MIIALASDTTFASNNLSLPPWTGYTPKFNGCADTQPGYGADQLDGGSGNDTYVYVHGGIATGGSGNDEVFAEHDGSEARGGSGNDFVGDYSQAGREFFHDATSNIKIDGGSGFDTCLTDGDDTLRSCQQQV